MITTPTNRAVLFMSRHTRTAALVGAAVLGLSPLRARAEGASETVSSDRARALLVEGNQRFVEGRVVHPHASAERRSEQTKGQNPFAIILSCADSRVGPELVFDQGIGDLFVVRVAGEVLDVPGLGSLEYAAEHLGTPLLVVLGHKKCGAVGAAVAGGHAPGHIHSLIKAIEPAVEETRGQSGDPVDLAVVAHVRRVVKQLREAEPILGELVKSGRLAIVGACYDLETGAVEFLP